MDPAEICRAALRSGRVLWDCGGRPPKKWNCALGQGMICWILGYPVSDPLALCDLCDATQFSSIFSQRVFLGSLAGGHFVVSQSGDVLPWQSLWALGSGCSMHGQKSCWQRQMGHPPISQVKKVKRKVNHRISGAPRFEKTSVWKNGRFSVTSGNKHAWDRVQPCANIFLFYVFLDGWIWDSIRILWFLNIGDPQNHRTSLFLGKEFQGFGVPNFWRECGSPKEAEWRQRRLWV